MSSLEEKLQEWMIRETSGLSEGRMKKLPEIPSIKRLIDGKNRKIWKYVVEHVKSKNSVNYIKNILHLKRTQNELHVIYPPQLNCNTSITKQGIVKVNAKVQFLENSLKNTKEYIFSSKSEIENLKVETSLLNQKCAYLELVVANYNAKNKDLQKILGELSLLLSTIFSSDKTKVFHNLSFWQSLRISNLNRLSSNDVDNMLRGITSQISSAIERRLCDENESTSLGELKNYITTLMSYVPVVDLINILRELSKVSENSFKENNSQFNALASTVKGKEQKLSEKYLQDMKLDHVNSSFHKIKILNEISRLPAAEEISLTDIFVGSNSESTMQEELVLVTAENEGLRQSISYLEESLSDTFQKTKCLVKANNKQKLECQDLKVVIQDFFHKLEAHKMYLNMSEQTFTSIRKALDCNQEYITTKLLCSSINHTEYLSDTQNDIRSDYKMSLELIQSGGILKPLPRDLTLLLNIPDAITDLLRIPRFQNKILIYQNLARAKKELGEGNVAFEFSKDIKVEQKFTDLMSNLENAINRMKAAEKDVEADTNKYGESLKLTLEDWWDQKAQFIPDINYDGKSLKMWLGLLHVCDDF